MVDGSEVHCKLISKLTIPALMDLNVCQFKIQVHAVLISPNSSFSKCIL